MLNVMHSRRRSRRTHGSGVQYVNETVQDAADTGVDVVAVEPRTAAVTDVLSGQRSDGSFPAAFEATVPSTATVDSAATVSAEPVRTGRAYSRSTARSVSQAQVEHAEAERQAALRLAIAKEEAEKMAEYDEIDKQARADEAASKRPRGSAKKRKRSAKPPAKPSPTPSPSSAAAAPTAAVSAPSVDGSARVRTASLLEVDLDQAPSARKLLSLSKDDPAGKTPASANQAHAELVRSHEAQQEQAPETFELHEGTSPHMVEHEPSPEVKMAAAAAAAPAKSQQEHQSPAAGDVEEAIPLDQSHVIREDAWVKAISRQHQPLNVLFFFLPSLSHGHFIRALPRTYEWIKKRKAGVDPARAGELRARSRSCY